MVRFRSACACAVVVLAAGCAPLPSDGVTESGAARVGVAERIADKAAAVRAAQRRSMCLDPVRFEFARCIEI